MSEPQDSDDLPLSLPDDLLDVPLAVHIHRAASIWAASPQRRPEHLGEFTRWLRLEVPRLPSGADLWLEGAKVLTGYTVFDGQQANQFWADLLPCSLPPDVDALTFLQQFSTAAKSAYWAGHPPKKRFIGPDDLPSHWADYRPSTS